ncbi:uncharacterized protein [Dysidea avara]|uniref:uncharacterized protein n=1 Tax=Dysidea avara TaxID=196820 RepID=UPI0033264F5D
MSKPKHLVISVVGLSGCGPDVYKGPGKSSLCFNLLHPAEFLKDHPSVLTQDQFESKVINQQHYIYWGSKTECYYQLPRSKKVTNEKIQVVVSFEIFEQTEFLEDVTKRSFPVDQEYAKRAFKLHKASQKVSFKTLDLIFSPEKYNISIAPDIKSMTCGYIFTVDVGKDCPTFQHQLKLMEKMITPKHRNKFVIAATKYDNLDPNHFEELRRVANDLKVEVVPTSIEMEDSRWATDAFRYLAIKLFNLETEGVGGGTYLRYASDEPSKPQAPDHTPPIPPRNYDESDLPEASPTSPKHKYFNLSALQAALTAKSKKKPPEFEDRTTEIPKSLLEKRSKTLDIPRRKPLHPSSLSPKSSPTVPQKGLSMPQSQPQSQSRMVNRPLPTLPFISQENDDVYTKFRCDYDKIDYQKMSQWRNVHKEAAKSRANTLPPATLPPATLPPATLPPDDGYVGPISSSPKVSAPKITHQKLPDSRPSRPPVKPRKKPPSSVPHSQPVQRPQDLTADCDYEDTVPSQSQTNVDVLDDGYVIEMINIVKPKYPPRCIPRKYYFLNGRRALPSET